MERKIQNCKHAMKSSCPNIGHGIMKLLFAGEDKNSITVELLDEIDTLCSNCEAFEAKP